jgi:hypothetical protein
MRNRAQVHHRSTRPFVLEGAPQNGGKKVKKIKFNGTRRKGTLTPRRIWSPGEKLMVEDEVAEALENDSEFVIVKKKRSGSK